MQSLLDPLNGILGLVAVQLTISLLIERRNTFFVLCSTPGTTILQKFMLKDMVVVVFIVLT